MMKSKTLLWYWQMKGKAMLQKKRVKKYPGPVAFLCSAKQSVWLAGSHDIVSSVRLCTEPSVQRGRPVSWAEEERHSIHQTPTLLRPLKQCRRKQNKVLHWSFQLACLHHNCNWTLGSWRLTFAPKRYIFVLNVPAGHWDQSTASGGCFASACEKIRRAALPASSDRPGGFRLQGLRSCVGLPSRSIQTSWRCSSFSHWPASYGGTELQRKELSSDDACSVCLLPRFIWYLFQRQCRGSASQLNSGPWRMLSPRLWLWSECQGGGLLPCTPTWPPMSRCRWRAWQHVCEHYTDSAWIGSASHWAPMTTQCSLSCCAHE